MGTAICATAATFHLPDITAEQLRLCQAVSPPVAWATCPYTAVLDFLSPSGEPAATPGRCIVTSSLVPCGSPAGAPLALHLGPRDAVSHAGQPAWLQAVTPGGRRGGFIRFSLGAYGDRAGGGDSHFLRERAILEACMSDECLSDDHTVLSRRIRSGAVCVAGVSSRRILTVLLSHGCYGKAPRTGELRAAEAPPLPALEATSPRAAGPRSL